jgi:hypothetical protein
MMEQMNAGEILDRIKETQPALRRQLLLVALITKLLEERGKPAPVVIGGCALSYYSREVYFTADVDLAYADREALDNVLTGIGFEKEGRYWIHQGLEMVVEVPVSILAGEEAPVEVADLGEGLRCTIIGIEDLVIDRLNACKHWKSEIDCEMVELLLNRYVNDLDWAYLEKKASRPENDTASNLEEFRRKVRR